MRDPANTAWAIATVAAGLQGGDFDFCKGPLARMGASEVRSFKEPADTAWAIARGAAGLTPRASPQVTDGGVWPTLTHPNVSKGGVLATLTHFKVSAPIPGVPI